MSNNRYNELTYAENLLENGFMSKYRRYELKVLAKYYKYNSIGYKEMEEKIYEFAKKHIDEFDEVRHFRLINHVMNYVRKKNSKLIIIESVPITESEIKYIDNINLEHQHKVFLFCLLVRFKLDKMLFEYCNDKEYFVDYFSHDVKRQKEVFKMTQLKANKKYDMNTIIKDLYDNDILDVLDSGKLRLNFLKDVSDDGPEYVRVDTISIDYAGLFYDLYNGDKGIKKCMCCGVIMKVRAKYHKYCKECAYKNKIKKNRIRIYKERRKIKMYERLDTQ